MANLISVAALMISVFDFSRIGVLTMKSFVVTLALCRCWYSICFFSRASVSPVFLIIFKMFPSSSPLNSSMLTSAST